VFFGKHAPKLQRVLKLAEIDDFAALAFSDCDSSCWSRKIEKLQEFSSLLAVFLQSK
jgi:hypothetical protein